MSRSQFAGSLLSVAASVFAMPADGGFITIDEFTSATHSDGLGQRSTFGMVKYGSEGIELSFAAPVAGTADGEVASVVYSFTPQPLVAVPIVLLLARNNQTNAGETGVLRGTLDGHSISYVLPGGQRNFVSYSFDFTHAFGGTVAMEEFRVDWFREDGHTGAKELLIDSIQIHEAPEPSTWALIAVVCGAAACRFRSRPTYSYTA